MVTLTPSSSTGRPPLTKSVFCQGRVVMERLLPLITTQEPASIPGWKLAPLTTEVTTGGAVASFTTNPSP